MLIFKIIKKNKSRVVLRLIAINLRITLIPIKTGSKNSEASFTLTLNISVSDRNI